MPVIKMAQPFDLPLSKITEMPFEQFTKCARLGIVPQGTSGFRIKVFWFEPPTPGAEPVLRPFRLVEDISVCGFSKHESKENSSIPGKGYAFKCKYGEMTMPTAENPMPIVTPADIVARDTLFFWSRIIRFIAQTCVAYLPSFNKFEIPFGEGGGFTFVPPSIPYLPTFQGIINHPTNIEYYKPYLKACGEKLEPWNAPVPGAELTLAASKLRDKDDASTIILSYMGKGNGTGNKGGKAIKLEKPYLTIYKGYLDYRAMPKDKDKDKEKEAATATANANATVATIYVSPDKVDEVMSLSCSPYKPTKVEYGKNKNAAFKPWELLGAPEGSQMHPVFQGTAYTLPEIWIGQTPGIRSLVKYFLLKNVSTGLGKGKDDDAPDFEVSPDTSNDIPTM